MAALSRRLAVLEERFGPAIVEAPPVPEPKAAVAPAVLEVCTSCGVWPLPSIQFDHDGSIRCGGCKSLVGWLPPWDCGYFGHRQPCTCGYSYEEDVRDRWFWTWLEPQAQEFLLALGQEHAARVRGSAA